MHASLNTALERPGPDLAGSVPAAEKAGDRPNMTSLLGRRPRFLQQGLGRWGMIRAVNRSKLTFLSRDTDYQDLSTMTATMLQFSLIPRLPWWFAS